MTASDDANPPPSPLHRHPGQIVALLALSALLLAGDLLLKSWSFSHITDFLTVIPNVLELRLVRNQGAVFGIGQGKVAFFVFITIVALVLIGFALLTSRRRQWIFQIALMFVLAGALGNLHDRVLPPHAVRDMLLLFPNSPLPFGLHWPGGQTQLYPWIFNLADVYLTLGIGTLIVRSLFFSGKGARD